jgi:hypothetical protein
LIVTRALMPLRLHSAAEMSIAWANPEPRGPVPTVAEPNGEWENGNGEQAGDPGNGVVDPGGGAHVFFLHGDDHCGGQQCHGEGHTQTEYRDSSRYPAEIARAGHGADQQRKPTTGHQWPMVIGQRGPMRWANAPIRLESSNMITVKGRKQSSAAVAVYPRDCCSCQGSKNSAPPNPVSLS